MTWSWALLLGLTSCNLQPIDEQHEIAPRQVTSTTLPLEWTLSLQDQYIVLFKPDAVQFPLRSATAVQREAFGKQLAHQTLDRLGVDADGKLEDVYHTAIWGFSAHLDPGAVEQLQRDPRIARVEKDQLIRLEGLQLFNTFVPEGQERSWGYERLGGSKLTHQQPTHTAWILDSGIDLTHPDLTVDLERSKSFLPWYYFEWDANDNNGHGTHVAGIVGAHDNGIGTVGIAAGANLVAVKVLSRYGTGTTSIILKGIDYITEQAAPGDVVNMSFGGGMSFILDWAVEAAAEKGIRFVLAAGNQRRDVAMISPAHLDADNVYTVSALGLNDQFAVFSNYGAAVDYCQPGTDIPSTYKGGTYAVLSGTSMAAPHLTGLLLLSNQVQLGSRRKVQGDPDGVPDPIMEMLR